MFNYLLINIKFKRIFFLSLLSLLTSNTLLANEPILRDPTQPKYSIGSNKSKAKNFTNSKYKIHQIYISKKNKRAIINNKKVKEGDWFYSSREKAKVVKIKQNSIELLINNKIKEIKLIRTFKKYN